MDYLSTITFESKCAAGVRYEVRKISFGRRIELIQQVRDLAAKTEYLEAGSDAHDKAEASLLSAEVDRTFMLWGLASIEGLEIDGQPATPETLLSRGPIDLCTEILAVIKAQFGLNEDERKN